MEFGLYVDPSSLTQRHALYDSEEEEENGKEAVDITISDAGTAPIKEGDTLIVAVETTASIFVQSYLAVVDGPVRSLVANSPTVFKGKFFPSPRSSHADEKKSEDPVCVSEVFAAKTNSEEKGSCCVCVHAKPLKPEYCNTWASKVKCVHFSVFRSRNIERESV